jgi:hypothetical protein
MFKKILFSLTLTGTLLAAGPVLAKDIMVCILDRSIPDNIALPGDLLALPESKLKFTQYSGKPEETQTVSLRELYKKKWTLIEVVNSVKAGERYSVYYMEK